MEIIFSLLRLNKNIIDLIDRQGWIKVCPDFSCWCHLESLAQTSRTLHIKKWKIWLIVFLLHQYSHGLFITHYIIPSTRWIWDKFVLNSSHSYKSLSPQLESSFAHISYFLSSLSAKCSCSHTSYFQGSLYFSFLPAKQRDFPGNVSLGGWDSLPLVLIFPSKQHESQLSYALHFLYIISHQMCCVGERAKCTTGWSVIFPVPWENRGHILSWRKLQLSQRNIAAGREGEWHV